MFPNPVEDILYFKIPRDIEQSTLTIYNVLGKVVLKKNIEKSDTSINVSSLASGLYVISLQSSHSTKSFKFIKS